MRHIPKTLIVSAILALTACGEKPAETQQNPVPQTSAPAQTASLTPEMRGKKVYKRCQACHTLDDGGRNMVGPNLYGVFGAKAGAKEGFTYSKIMSESEIIWTAETLSAYLENPRAFMPGNRMSFAGLRKAEQRDDVIAYMKAETGAK